RPDRKADAFFTQRRLYARRRVEPEGRAAGKDEAVEFVERVVRLQRVGLARARRAAQHLHRGDARVVGQHHGDAAFQLRILDIADLEAADIGDEVSRAG